MSGTRHILRLASLVLLTTLFASAAMADARGELQRIQQQSQQLAADRQEYTEGVQDYIFGLYKRIFDHGVSLPLDSLKPGEVQHALKTLNEVRKLATSEDRSEAAKELLNKTLNDELERVASKVSAELLKKYGSLAAKGAGAAVSLAPSIVDGIFDLLTYRQYRKQLEDLDRRQADLDKTRTYWERRMRGEPTTEALGEVPGDSASRPLYVGQEFERFTHDLRMRVRTSADVVRSGEAQVTAKARNGFSQADLRIVSSTDEWLAIDLSGGYFIPSDDQSSAQRLGLVSPVQSSSSNQGVTRSLLRLAVAAAPNALGTAPERGVARGTWVVVAPRADIVIPFHSVCLDKTRAGPSSGEAYYAADRSLPTRIQRILMAGAWKSAVPQDLVWNTIRLAQLAWYDPRNDQGADDAKIDSGFPPNAKEGLYVYCLGPANKIYVAPRERPKDDDIVQEKYLKGRPPVYLPDIAPGNYQIMAVFDQDQKRDVKPEDKHFSCPDSMGYVSSWGPPGADGKWTVHAISNMLGGQVEKGRLEVVWFNLLPDREELRTLEEFYPDRYHFPLREQRVRDALEGKFDLKAEEVTWAIRMLKRGGGVTLHRTMFMFLRPGTDCFSVFSFNRITSGYDEDRNLENGVREERTYSPR